MGRRTRFFDYCIKYGLVQNIEEQLRCNGGWMTAQQITDYYSDAYKKLPINVYRICRILQYLKHNGKVENMMFRDHTYVWRLKVVN